jgi:hypothetical protein
LKLTIFYCWQSDRPEKLCKAFIGKALEDAATRLKARRGVDIVIDSDTQNVPGQPPVTDTILEKIRAADAVVTDLTFVAETPGGKPVPNPNVMAEFGYALRDKSWKRILFAMNEAFGPPSQLPFDMGHVRFPARYNLAREKPDAARRSAREAFSARLEQNIEAILDAVLANVAPPPDVRPALGTLANNTYQQRYANNHPAIIASPAAYIYLVPASALAEPYLSLELIERWRAALAPSNSIARTDGPDHQQWWSRGQLHRLPNLPNPVADWRGRLIRPGILEYAFNIATPYEGDDSVVVDVFGLESKTVNVVDRGLQFFDHLGIAGPTLVQIILEDVNMVVLNGAPRLGKIGALHLHLGPTMVPAKSLRSGTLLRPQMDKLWLAGGAPSGSLSYRSGSWAGYEEGNAYPGR